MNISTIIIAKNEADRIVRTIASALPISHEVLVVDTGSDDDTITVCEAAGARVIRMDWLGYGATKNKAVLSAQSDWILSLDADEVVNADLQHAIKKLQPQEGNIYFVNRIINYKGQWIKNCDWHPDWVPRLYHRNNAQWNHAAVHEQLLYEKTQKEVKLDGLLEHYSFRSKRHFIDKTDEYALLAAKEWFAQGETPSIAKRLLGPWWKYMQIYYLRQGYKDGKAGREIAEVLAEGVRKKLKFYYNIKDR